MFSCKEVKVLSRKFNLTMRFSSLSWIFSILIGLSLSQSAPESDYCSWKNNGNYQHPDCSKYYNCDWGKTKLSVCPSGSVFNQVEQYGQCTARENVPSCQLAATPETATSGVIENFNCLNRPDGFYRHRDCTKFYRCYFQKLQINNCPTNLYFNIDMEYCDHQINVPDCIGGTMNPGATPGTTPPPPLGFCSEKSNGSYLHSKCSDKFYSCFGGATTILNCPSGQVFNQYQYRCISLVNDPECGGSTGTTNPPTDLFCYGKPNGNFWHSKCSDKYYSCLEGATNVLNCPSKQVFNHYQRQCISLANDPECGGSIVTTAGPPPVGFCTGKANGRYLYSKCSDKFYSCYKEETTVSNCPSRFVYNQHKDRCISLTNDQECGGSIATTTPLPPVGYCSGKPNGNYQYSKCSGKFYSCFSQVTKVIDCPIGLLYSPVDNHCLPRQNIPECNGLIDHATTPSPIVDTFSCANRMDGFYRHTDCSKYYQCVARKVYIKPCPTGLYFNHKTIACDYPINVPDCINGILNRDEDIKEVKPTTNVPVTSSHSFSCQSRTDGFYQHPDCTKFYRCYSNKVYINSCPKGLYYNPDFFYCDYPQNVPECVGGTVNPDYSNDQTVPVTSLPQPQPGEFSCDGKSNGMYIHVDDCSKFYSCYDGKVSKMNCAEGFVFNPSKKHCDLPKNVPECKNRRRRNTEEEFTCDNRDDGYYIHKDCRKYYLCLAERKIVMNCTVGLVYNADLKTCDWPRNVPRCKNPTQETTESPIPTTSPSPFCLSHGNGAYPIAGDCFFFYHCWKNQLLKLPCPKGLVFNDKLNFCDWPQRVEQCQNVTILGKRSIDIQNKTNHHYLVPKCKNGLMKKHEDCSKYYICLNQTIYVHSCPSQLVFNNKKARCDWKNNVPECSFTNLDQTRLNRYIGHFSCRYQKDKFYKNEDDCGTYFQCVKENLFVLPCPKGLLFNEKTEICDWPSNVPSCFKISTVPTTQESKIKDSDPASCNGKRDGYYKHSECTKFYRCSSEIQYVLPCPSGLVFNEKLASCDWPRNVPECKDAKVRAGRDTTTTFSCKDKPDGFYKHQDCSKYFRCISAEHYEQDCPLGLYFSQKSALCDWPDNVPECKPKEEIVVVTVDNGFCKGKQDGYYKHKNCSKFYHCLKKETLEQECRDELYFNENTLTCDWPANVPECYIKEETTVVAVDNGFCKGKQDGYYKHKNCSKFYHCLKEETLEQECRDELYFNENTLTCDWPANVPECYIKEETTVNPTTNEEFSCPNKIDHFYKHPNCRLYYRCINGVVSIQSCDKGFFFNPEKAYCDWKANVPECKKLA